MQENSIFSEIELLIDSRLNVINEQKFFLVDLKNLIVSLLKNNDFISNEAKQPLIDSTERLTVFRHTSENPISIDYYTESQFLKESHILQILSKKPLKFGEIVLELKKGNINFVDRVKLRNFLDLMCLKKDIIFLPQSKTEPYRWKLNLDLENNADPIQEKKREHSENDCLFPPSWISNSSIDISSLELDFSNMTLREAILCCFRKKPLCTIDNLISFLRKGKIKTKSTNIHHSIYNALTQLKNKNYIQTAGKGVWKLSSSFIPPVRIECLEQVPILGLPENFNLFSIYDLLSHVLYKNVQLSMDGIVNKIREINENIDLGKNKRNLWSHVTYLQKKGKIMKIKENGSYAKWCLSPFFRKELSHTIYYTSPPLHEEKK